MPGITTTQMLQDVRATGAGDGVRGSSDGKTYQAWGKTTTGAGAATIAVQGSNNGGVTWDTIGTISLTLSTTATSDSFSSDDRYALVRGNVTALSGTGATASLSMSS